MPDQLRQSSSFASIRHHGSNDLHWAVMTNYDEYFVWKKNKNSFILGSSGRPERLAEKSRPETARTTEYNCK